MLGKLIRYVRDIITVFKGYYIIIHIDKRDIVPLVKGEECCIKANYNGLRDYPAILMLKTVADKWDDDDLILLKAIMEGEMSHEVI